MEGRRGPACRGRARPARAEEAGHPPLGTWPKFPFPSRAVTPPVAHPGGGGPVATPSRRFPRPDSHPITPPLAYTRDSRAGAGRGAAEGAGRARRGVPPCELPHAASPPGPPGKVDPRPPGPPHPPVPCPHVPRGGPGGFPDAAGPRIGAPDAALGRGPMPHSPSPPAAHVSWPPGGLLPPNFHLAFLYDLWEADLCENLSSPVPLWCLPPGRHGVQKCRNFALPRLDPGKALPGRGNQPPPPGWLYICIYTRSRWCRTSAKPSEVLSAVSLPDRIWPPHAVPVGGPQRLPSGTFGPSPTPYLFSHMYIDIISGANDACRALNDLFRRGSPTVQISPHSTPPSAPLGDPLPGLLNPLHPPSISYIYL